LVAGVGRVVDLCQTFEDRKVMGLLNEEADAVLELAGCLPTDRRSSLKYTGGDGNKADCCPSGKKGGVRRSGHRSTIRRAYKRADIGEKEAKIGE